MMFFFAVISTHHILPGGIPYMILITDFLISTFKKLNHIESFKLAKKRFVEELRRGINYDTMVLYQYNPWEFKTCFIF